MGWFQKWDISQPIQGKVEMRRSVATERSVPRPLHRSAAAWKRKEHRKTGQKCWTLPHHIQTQKRVENRVENRASMELKDLKHLQSTANERSRNFCTLGCAPNSRHFWCQTAKPNLCLKWRAHSTQPRLTETIGLIGQWVITNRPWTDITFTMVYPSQCPILTNINLHNDLWVSQGRVPYAAPLLIFTRP